MSFDCPYCKKPLSKEELGYFCHSCQFSLPFVYREKRLDEKLLLSLLTTGKSDITAWSRHDTGSHFYGHLVLTSDKQVKLIPHYLSDASCPLCKGKILSTPIGWECSSGDVKVWETIAQRKLTLSEARHLFIYGQTDELAGFVSKETDKRFSARLKIDRTGAVVFLFS